MTDVATVLSAAERDLLELAESTIACGLKTFVEVGQALMDVRDNRLYRTDFPTFEEYCVARWSISRPRAYELMTAAEVVSGIPDTLPRPGNAGQAVELARVPEADRAEVWRETVERGNGRPTAATIREVVRERQTSPSTPDSPAGRGHTAPDPTIAPVTNPDRSGSQPSTVTGQDLPAEPERPRPSAWDPEERRRHEEEVRRLDDIRSARQQATTLVTDVRALVFTVLQGSRQGEKNLVTRGMIADLRKAIDLLEGEIHDGQ